MLTPRQRDVLRAVRDLTTRRGPTVRDIGKALGLSSTCTIQRHLAELVKKGLLRKSSRESRGIEVTSAGLAELNPVPAPAEDSGLTRTGRTSGSWTAVMCMESWENHDRLRGAGVGGPGVGFIPVYATEEDALRDFPDGPFMRVRRCDEDPAAGEACGG